MSDEFKVQWSVSLPPAAQYAKGHMLNVRGNTVAEVEDQFDEILAPNSAFIEKATEVAKFLVAAQVIAEPQSGGATQSAAQQQPSAGSGHFCPHGQRVYREGNGRTGHWEGYFCPLEKGNPAQCKPEFVDNK